MLAQPNAEQPEPQYDASIIIPTFNRYESLLETLDALAGQSLPASSFEVVVVNDGSTDATAQVASLTYPFHLEYVAQTNQGAAAARNRGAKASHGRLLVFIDDDITLKPGYLAAILATHRHERNLVSMGVFQPYLTGQDSTYALHHARQVAAEIVQQNGRETSFVECSSNNLAIEKKDFLSVGLWQDVFGDGPTLWGDVEFGFRAWQQGFQFARVAGAKLYHRDQHAADLRAACQRAYHIARTVHLLFEKQPEIAKYIPAFQDKEPLSLTSDPPHLIGHKLFHQITAWHPVLWLLTRLAQVLEKAAPESRLLGLLYRWIVSAYLFRGYRRGLDEARQD